MALPLIQTRCLAQTGMLRTKLLSDTTSRLSRSVHDQQQPADLVPEHDPVPWPALRGLQYFIDEFSKILVITGAGVSTESGIPDYRSKDVGSFFRTPYAKPMSYQTFIGSAKARQRYWARNYVAWPQFSSKQPNCNHKILSEWESEERVHWLVTQNVDRLHHKAGSKRVTELHGTTYEVVCHSCPAKYDRHELQAMITDRNPDFQAVASHLTPDGDVELSDAQITSFNAPQCSCGGFVRPNVVFFGDNVPIPKVEEVSAKLTEANALFILGSSLNTYSAYRYVLQAIEKGKPVALVNIGPSRADDLVDIKIDGRCSEVLARLAI